MFPLPFDKEGWQALHIRPQHRDTRTDLPREVELTFSSLYSVHGCLLAHTGQDQVLHPSVNYSINLLRTLWYFLHAACLALLIMITFVCACNIGTWIIFLGWLVFAGDWYVVSTYLNYMHQLISTPLLKLHVPDWQGEEAFILLTFSKMTHLASWALLITVCWLILISLCHAPSQKKDAMPKVREHLV